VLLFSLLKQLVVEVLKCAVDLRFLSLELIGNVRVVLNGMLDVYLAEHGLRRSAVKPSRQRRKILFATVLEALHRSGHHTARIKPLIIVLQISLLLDSLEMLGNGPDCGCDVGLKEVLDEEF